MALKVDPKKCVVCGEILEQDYRLAPSISPHAPMTQVPIGSHCPNCGLKYIQDVASL